MIGLVVLFVFRYDRAYLDDGSGLDESIDR
jgi:hypothetical protein